MELTPSRLPQLLGQHQAAILDEWLKLQRTAVATATTSRERRWEDRSRELLELVTRASAGGTFDVYGGANWSDVRALLEDLSREGARQSISPMDVAAFVLSLKQPVFDRLQQECDSPAELARELWTTTSIVDRLALITTEQYQRGREEVIARQQQELLELSTPVVALWDGVLAVPLIGTLDSARTQIVMENLLQRIVETGSSLAIIDITGVPTVDTLVAQHLLKTVSAARLMGAECIISGIRPQIAQTIVHLGVELGDVATKATLADALRLALQRLGLSVTRTQGQTAR